MMQRLNRAMHFFFLLNCLIFLPNKKINAYICRGIFRRVLLNRVTSNELTKNRVKGKMSKGKKLHKLLKMCIIDYVIDILALILNTVTAKPIHKASLTSRDCLAMLFNKAKTLNFRRSEILSVVVRENREGPKDRGLHLFDHSAKAMAKLTTWGFAEIGVHDFPRDTHHITSFAFQAV